MQYYSKFARYFYLLPVVGGMLLYGLGAGIAHYLGTSIDINIYIFGQIWVISIQFGTIFLDKYFSIKNDSYKGINHLETNPFLIISIVLLTVTASFTVLLVRFGDLVPATLMIMVICFVGAFFYATPPIRFKTSPYKSLFNGIFLSNLIPALAFILQTGELHRLLAMSTFPLTPLFLSLEISIEFPNYATAIKTGCQTILTSLGWENSIRLHNIFIWTAFLILTLAVMFGMPFHNAQPVFYLIPLGLFQIWYLTRIADGASPNWIALRILSIFLYGSAAYLLTITFWIR